MYRCQTCPARMELRKRKEGVLWVCPRCQKVAATVAAWERAQAHTQKLNQLIQASRGVRATAAPCPVCKKSMTPVKASNHDAEFCKPCRILMLENWRVLIPEATLEKGAPQATAQDKEMQNKAVLAVVKMKINQESSEREVTIKSITWGTYIIIGGSLLVFLSQLNGSDILSWRLFAASPFQHMGIPIIIHPLLHIDLIAMLFFIAVLWKIGREVEDVVGTLNIMAFKILIALFSATFAGIFFSKGALMGMGGVCTGMVLLHSLVFPNRRSRLDNRSEITIEGHRGRAFGPAGKILKIPFMAIYILGYTIISFGRFDVSLLLIGTSDSQLISGVNVIPHIVGVIMAIVWFSRLPSDLVEN